MKKRLVAIVLILLVLGVSGFVYIKYTASESVAITNPEYNPNYAYAIEQKNPEFCSSISYALKYQLNGEINKIYGEPAVEHCKSQVEKGYIECECNVAQLLNEIKMTEAPEALNVSSKLSNATIVKLGGPDTLQNYVQVNLVIFNNSDKTIGLDPNGCDYETYINGEKLENNYACHAIGGVNEVAPGGVSKRKVTTPAPNAKASDTIYIEYGYMLLLPEFKGNAYSYSHFDSDFVKSNTEIVK